MPFKFCEYSISIYNLFLSKSYNNLSIVTYDRIRHINASFTTVLLEDRNYVAKHNIPLIGFVLLYLYLYVYILLLLFLETAQNVQNYLY